MTANLDYEEWLRPGYPDRIYPSAYSIASTCALRAAFVMGRSPPLLPVAPTAHVGRVIHKLLEESARAPLPEPAEERWRTLVRDVENMLAEDILSRRFVPLRDHDPLYEVKRLRTLRVIGESRGAAPGAAPIVRGDREVGSELWVESADQSVVGSIDSVALELGELVLRDYKSGLVSEDADPDSPLREEYVQQVKLYAALYHDRFQRWPDRIVLVPLQGTAREVSYTADDCERVLADAKVTLSKIQSAIKSSLDTESLQACLGTPGESACAWCPYRPGCAPYWQALPSFTENTITDIRGTVLEARSMPNETGLIRLDRGGVELVVRGLTPAYGLDGSDWLLTDGDSVRVFSVRRSAENRFVESRFTVVRRMPAQSP